MIQVTAETLRDFQACKLYYKYEHVDEVEVRVRTEHRTRAMFSDTLKSMFNFFFFRKLSGQEPSYKSMESRWQRRWLKEMSAVDIALGENSARNIHPSDSYYTTRAAASLLAFHKWFADHLNMEVVLIDEPFSVALNKKVSLNGTFDLILRNKKQEGGYKYHVYHWSMTNPNTTQDEWGTLFTTIDYAFRYRNKFSPDLDVSYYLWDFARPTPSVREYLIEVQDHKLLEFWANDLSSAVQSETYYPIRGLSSYCKGCRHDKLCREWPPREDING